MDIGCRAENCHNGIYNKKTVAIGPSNTFNTIILNSYKRNNQINKNNN